MAPKVNVWAVRKEQLAHAAPATDSAASPADAEHATGEPSTAAAPADGKQAQSTTDEREQAKAGAAATAGKAHDAPRRPQPKKAAPATDADVATSNGPAAPKARAAITGNSRKASSAGWQTAAAAGKQKGPVVVAGEDATSWPAPVEAVKELDEAAKQKQEQEKKAAKASKSSAQQKKKKGDKWVPIKADITVASAGASKSRGKAARGNEGKAGGEKKAGEASGKAAKGSPQHPLPAKPVAASSPSNPSGQANDTAALHPVPDPSNPCVSPSGSASGSHSGAHSSEPSSAVAPSDAAGSTPATTAASSTDGGDAAHASPYPQSSAAHPHAANSASRGGRGRGGSAPSRSVRGGRGGAVSGGGGAPAQNNNPNRFFHQQQHAAMQAAGYVPVPVDVDPTGATVLDAYGKPVPQPVLAQAVGPVQIDPRMLDPTRYWLLGQIEWWFSVDNLCRDLFLRQSMDTSGWIPISLIASFNRIKNLTNDIKIVVECMRMTPLLEVSPKDRFVRLAQTWPQWVLPNAQTNEDVKKDFEEGPAASPAPAAAEPAAKEPEKSATPRAPGAEDVDPAPHAAYSNSRAEPTAETAQPAPNGAAEDTSDSPGAALETEAAEENAALKISPPPRRGSPAAPHAVSPKASLAQPILDVAAAAVVTVSAPPKSS